MEALPDSLIFLGFDFGTKKIGVAVGQNVTKTATPLSMILVKNDDFFNQILELIKIWNPQAIVVGVPFHMNGSEQELTKAARMFAKRIGVLSKLPVYEVDERLTTKMAREEVFAKGGYKALQKTEIDSIAAQLILESWMRENLK